jgi:RNA polymerase sigma-70 factor (ECF subfamily)
VRAAASEAARSAPEPPGAGQEVDLERALRAAQDGDQAAFALLYRHLQPRLLRYATALVGAEAEDATAETWLHVARGLRGFVGDLDGFRGWVTTICRNRAIDTARRRARRPAEDIEPTALVDQQDACDSVLGTLSTRWAVEQILALPRTEAEAVLLRTVVGLDTATAARVLGKRPGAVRVAAHRGLRRLAALLDDGSRTVGGGDG